MKYFEQTLATYVYNQCNIWIYICNIHAKHLQHTSEISKTAGTYIYHMCFQCNMAWAVRRTDVVELAVASGTSPHGVVEAVNPSRRGWAAWADGDGRGGKDARCGRGESTWGSRK
jgi:hypothetical protein